MRRPRDDRGRPEKLTKGHEFVEVVGNQRASLAERRGREPSPGRQLPRVRGHAVGGGVRMPDDADGEGLAGLTQPAGRGKGSCGVGECFDEREDRRGMDVFGEEVEVIGQPGHCLAARRHRGRQRHPAADIDERFDDRTTLCHHRDSATANVRGDRSDVGRRPGDEVEHAHTVRPHHLEVVLAPQRGQTVGDGEGIGAGVGVAGSGDDESTDAASRPSRTIGRIRSVRTCTTARSGVLSIALSDGTPRSPATSLWFCATGMRAPVYPSSRQFRNATLPMNERGEAPTTAIDWGRKSLSRSMGSLCG